MDGRDYGTPAREYYGWSRIRDWLNRQLVRRGMAEDTGFVVRSKGNGRGLKVRYSAETVVYPIRFDESGQPVALEDPIPFDHRDYVGQNPEVQPWECSKFVARRGSDLRRPMTARHPGLQDPKDLEQVWLTANTEGTFQTPAMQNNNPGWIPAPTASEPSSLAQFPDIVTGMSAICETLERLRAGQSVTEREILCRWAEDRKESTPRYEQFADIWGWDLDGTMAVAPPHKWRSWLEWHEYDDLVQTIIGALNDGLIVNDTTLVLATREAYSHNSPF